MATIQIEEAAALTARYSILSTGLYPSIHLSIYISSWGWLSRLGGLAVCVASGYNEVHARSKYRWEWRVTC